MTVERNDEQRGKPVVIPDRLHRLLKLRAAREGKTIREIVEANIENLVCDERKREAEHGVA